MSENENTPVVVQLQAAKPIPVRFVEKRRRSEKPKLPSQLIQEAMTVLWSDPWIKIGIGITAVVIILGVLFRFQYFGRYSSPINQIDNNTGIAYNVNFSENLAVGDEEILSITLINTNPVSVTQVVGTLVFSDSASILMLGEKPSNSIDFGELKPGEQKTCILTFKVAQYTANIIESQLYLTTENEPAHPVKSIYEFNVTPITNLKSGIRWIFGSLPILLLSVLGWMFRGAFKNILPEK